MSSQEPLTLDQLGETYEVIGEMSGRADARTFMAKRRADGADVLITVATTPAGDEGNALSHLAADANLLSGKAHRNLVPIIEGRWIGTDAFALITERVNAKGLDELLARREEEFDFPRIALILQEVNGLLEWARAQKVVHRAIGINTLYLEPGSDRVLVTFVVSPLPLAGMPGPDDDVRTIAQLARAMMTRSASDPARANRPLAELRPGLPSRLVEQTDALLASSRDSEKLPDARGYIAVVAMAEPLKRSETESAETTRRLLEEERVSRETIEAERQSCERHAAEQQRLFEKEKEEYAKERAAMELAFIREKEAAQAALARETESVQRTFAKESEAASRALAKESEEAKRALAKESEAAKRALAKETAAAQKAIAREKAAMERERAALAKERAALAKFRAELQAQKELYAQTMALPNPPRSLPPVGDIPPVASMAVADIVADDDLEPDEELASPNDFESDPAPVLADGQAFDDPELANDVAPSPGFTPVMVPFSRASGTRRGPTAFQRIRASLPDRSRLGGKRPWLIPAGAAALVLLVAVALLAFGRDRDAAPSNPTRAVPVARVVESAAGVAAVRLDSTVSAIGVPADFVSGVAARAIAAPPVRPAQPTQPTQRPASRPVDMMPATRILRDTIPRADTLTGTPSVFPRRPAS